MKKAKAKHTIVHDGQSLAPGTIFECPEKLYDELILSGAIEAPKDDSKVEAVKLKPVVSPQAPVVVAPGTPLAAPVAPPQIFRPQPSTPPFVAPPQGDDGLGK
jgi:hypothetical protein